MSHNWFQAVLRRVSPLFLAAGILLLLAVAAPAAAAGAGPPSTGSVAPPRVDEVGGSEGTTGTSGTMGNSGTSAEGMTEGWTQVVTGGFTDPNNWSAPTWAKFKDYLYISTSANESGSAFSGSGKAGGDIWRTVDGVAWEQIGTAGLGNPHNNLFQLIVFREKLYAISNNINDHGIEIWVTSDGTQFTKIENGGFGDKENNWAFPFVFQDRLILGVSNGETGAEIWVSDDGQSFRQVVDGGMGDAGVTGFGGFADPEHADPIFQGKLYVGVSNPASGGEIWRTADGLKWERVADEGLTRSTTKHISPDIVYQDHLYAFATAGGTIDNILGFDLFRTTDGTTWEQVVDDGFSVGKERNVHGDLVEFKGRLYLTSNTMDPRVLMPTNPTERLAPRGFQLRVSDDGKTWKQIGEDGFGLASSIMAGMDVIGDVLYLTIFDYHEGSQLWRSSDGEKWELIFREPEPNFFQEGGGPLDFKGHFLWISNDLKNGLAIWRSDEVMVAEVTTTTGSGSSSTTDGDTATSGTGIGSSDGGMGGDGGTGGGGDGSQNSEGGGLSSGWVALIVVLAVVAVAAIVALAFLLGRMGRGPRTGAPDASGTAGTTATLAETATQDLAATRSPAVTQVSSQETSAAPAFCSACGTSLDQEAKYCPACGKQL